MVIGNLETEEERLSKLNSAGIVNITLENLWRESYSAMTRADLVTWNRKLDAIWLILAGDVKENDENEKAYDKIELKIYKIGPLKSLKIGFEALDEKQQAGAVMHYLLLKKKALFLRRLQNKQGKGTAYISDDEDDFD
jgi:hypothetical protein